MAEKVTGPKSYFPSIEKKYGQPIDYRMTQLDAMKDAKHMEQVAHLKGLGMESYFDSLGAYLAR